ncbi:ABC transporter ATP-binding protein [Bacillus thuringiensis]|uniref:ABC transporter domain-containing protein n=4 Tax=Bacillus TaxID=1386 RepID=A0A9X6KW89_BACTU|nr:ABC transporter ATP-binding protein [Bacillus thuringiensis]OTY80893.1 hypothetical protein BK755_27250 [Bacillus thuringiensis serovar aizawai]KAB1374739.1 ABC transporter ATP-binding protein [Bacillus thuringiensis]MDR5038771.1 ABC transporter ATP-binding protein [Bacillus thuringiensis]OTY98733.1 hypothetical protein BK756_31715 [Bacillus thuringiensis serovar aizawai]OTZ08299.1 hypothetical protein BK758_06960 [Bacillus thuringiensis serovar aizawai]
MLLVFQIKQGKLTVGDYVALMSAIITIQSTLGSIGMNVGKIFEINLYVKNLFEFLQLKNPLQNKEKTLSFPESDFSKIEVKNLSFNYPNQNQTTLKNINFTIKRGERIAIVGENGAGKTTLTNCLLGLYIPSNGGIYFDNININNIKISSLRKNISAVFQDFVKYHYTIRENVGFGNLEDLHNNEKIYSGLHQVNLDSLINKFPLGIDAILGKEFKNGQDLSGGQWQRIAIARAFLSEAEILILDEPTSAIDPKAELEIFNCFQNLAQGKTAFMISHRLGPARLADKILVLKEGILVEQGTHEDLMKLNGEYTRMYNAQANMYKENEEDENANLVQIP